MSTVASTSAQSAAVPVSQIQPFSQTATAEPVSTVAPAAGSAQPAPSSFWSQPLEHGTKIVAILGFVIAIGGGISGYFSNQAVEHADEKARYEQRLADIGPQNADARKDVGELKSTVTGLTAEYGSLKETIKQNHDDDMAEFRAIRQSLMDRGAK